MIIQVGVRVDFIPERLCHCGMIEVTSPKNKEITFINKGEEKFSVNNILHLNAVSVLLVWGIVKGFQ